MIKPVVIFVLMFLSLGARAYVPEYGTIASRAADQHGRGVYQIEQEVTLRQDTESYVVKETWTVTGENNLRVTLEGRGPLKGVVQGTFVYDGSLRSFVDASGAARSQRVGDDWLEPMFHFRSSKYFRSRLVNLKVVPAETLQDRPPLNFEGTPQYTPPSFIRLSRVGGSVSWAIGLNPTVGAGPTVWLEQDQFVLRKFRTANNVVLRADNYGKFDNGLWYPRAISYTFGNTNVQISTLSVKFLGAALGASDNRLRASSLVAAKDALRLPESDGLREFYSRFR